VVLSKKVIISIVVISLFVASSYFVEYMSKERGLNSAKIIKVLDNGKLAALMDTDTLMQLENKGSSYSKDEKAKGPALLSVIAAAGVDNFNTVEVKGRSVYQIKKDEINRDYIFYFTDHGTVNLYKKNTDRFLVEDVSEINTERYK